VRGCGYAYVSPRVASIFHPRLKCKDADIWQLGTPAPGNFAAMMAVIKYVAEIGLHFSPELKTLREQYAEGMKHIHLQERALLYRMLEGSDEVPGLRHIPGVMVYTDIEDLTKKDLIVAMGIKGIELLDSAGVQVASAMDSLMAFGRVLRKKSELKGIIPMITAVFGNCGGSQAVCAQMSDFLLLENQAQLYLIPSDAVIGNKDEELQSADHQEKSGNIDFKGTTEELAEKIRSLISFLPKDNLGGYEYEPAEDSLNRAAENFSQLHGENAVIELADDRICRECGCPDAGKSPAGAET
jgi:hypothetical protein